jgi:hypothetical protein
MKIEKVYEKFAEFYYPPGGCYLDYKDFLQVGKVINEKWRNNYIFRLSFWDSLLSLLVESDSEHPVLLRWNCSEGKIQCCIDEKNIWKFFEKGDIYVSKYDVHYGFNYLMKIIFKNLKRWRTK